MIKVGIIGVGLMGRNHIRNYLELSDIYDFVGFFDVGEENAKIAKEMFNIKSFDTMEDLLKEVDAVSIVVPSSLHKKIGLEVCKNGGVHALIEKPIALTKEDGEELTEAFKKNNKVLSVGHIERFNPVVLELKKRLKDEKIISIEAKRCGPYDTRISDTNVILDLMIHDLDLVMHEFNTSGVKYLKALGVHAKSNNRIDYINATIQHNDGVISSLIASRVTQIKIRTIEVHTMDSYYVADLLNRTIETYKNPVLKGDGDKFVQENVCSKESINGMESLRKELIEFANAIKDGKSRVSGEDATRAVAYANEIENEAKDFSSIR